MPSSARRDPASPAPRDPWRFVVVYVDRNDPRFLVPRRTGRGRTLNVGHPRTGAIALLVFGALFFTLHVL